MSRHSIITTDTMLLSSRAVDVTVCETDLPLAAALGDDDIAIAFITSVRGASYRPVGAAMVIAADGRTWGHLSSGCLDRDVTLHATRALTSNTSCCLRYGDGSPYMDIVLPCGGALDVTIIPRPDRALLKGLQHELYARRPAALMVTANGRLSVPGPGAGLVLRILPQIRFLICGKGPEAVFFARIAQGAGYAVDLFAPDEETLLSAGFGRPILNSGLLVDMEIDRFTAVALFFHDHDYETDLLMAALCSEAFFIGAQGSRRAHSARCTALAKRGVSDASIARIAHPFGLIPSTRDPRSLAVSVLAHILDSAIALRMT
ncbi:XdhC family protein [Paracoccus liaowanqingii]|uniref:XdhC family protein n=1 Tax=Paracoccus liaowanqingii TaxID=2560053 RepID=A0A4Z1CA66_9RHOB|nr:XdhC family protein [Paracoccus liaowanqingii]TGN61975.1 XdhC family protein [Paracoccus liaowanqingii]